MKATLLLAAAAAVSTAFAWLEQPPSTADPNTISLCSWWVIAPAATTCEAMFAGTVITLAQYRIYNPSLATTCTHITGNSYCVENNYGISTGSTTTTAPATTGNGVVTPTPIQTGMTNSCKTFYFVNTGDACPGIATAHGITLAQFYAWNPAVGSTCTTLWASTYVCVGIIGGTTATTTTPPTTTTTGNGIATPSPFLPGMVTNCDLFDLVTEGETCASISTARGILLTDFMKFNPSIPAGCATGLWLGYSVCVSIVGHTTFTTTTTRATTTTVSNGISTPVPWLPGMVSNCDLFDLVREGETCASIATQRGVLLTDFMKFNPSIPAGCATGLWLGYSVCVSIIGHTTFTTTTTRATTTTKPANGITTPTPIQAGMVKNCDTFDIVQTGETCAIIASARQIPLASLYLWNPAVGSSCQTLWLGYYICVGLI